MARKPRIHYPGAVYHIIARGNNREAVFQESEDKAKYLSLIEKYKQKHHFLLYAFVLMDNHIHLLGRVHQKPIGKFMQGVQQSYTQYFNHKYGRVGHVFEQRYKAKLCKQDSYLLNLVRYIHLNPVKTGSSPNGDYRWSSHYNYQTGVSGVADPTFILSMLSLDKQEAIRMYLNFIKDSLTNPKDDEIEQFYLADEETLCNPNNQARHPVPFEEILRKVSMATGIAPELILREKYNRQISAARDILIYLAVEAGGITKTELTKILSLSIAGIIKSFNKVLENHQMRQWAESFLKEFK